LHFIFIELAKETGQKAGSFHYWVCLKIADVSKLFVKTVLFMMQPLAKKS
jgi:hypothetical protein